MVAQVAVCGTRSGYNRHRRLGEEACGPCRAANSRRVREQRAEARRPEVPPALVPHPGAAGAVPDRVAELRWQVEQLREGMVWAVVNDPGKVAAMARERRETLGELEQAEHAAGIDGAGSDELGRMLEGPWSLGPPSPPSSS